MLARPLSAKKRTPTKARSPSPARAKKAASSASGDAAPTLGKGATPTKTESSRKRKRDSGDDDADAASSEPPRKVAVTQANAVERRMAEEGYVKAELVRNVKKDGVVMEELRWPDGTVELVPVPDAPELARIEQLQAAAEKAAAAQQDAPAPAAGLCIIC